MCMCSTSESREAKVFNGLAVIGIWDGSCIPKLLLLISKKGDDLIATLTAADSRGKRKG